jgi:hypothetical protein
MASLRLAVARSLAIGEGIAQLLNDRIEGIKRA